jgi:hypothetical protein
VISWRISKYNPKYRNKKDEYQKNEWTSCHDIGKLYDSKEFTVDDYMAVENAYINTVLSFMNGLNIKTLTAQYLEKYFDSLNCHETPLVYTEEMKELFERLHEGYILEIRDVEHLCRLVLREQLWCKLENDNKMFIHFGYDYYMYIGSLLKPKEVINLIENIGIFIEIFESPYL